MPRPVLIPSLIALALMAGPVAAQEMGGVKLTPEVLAIDDNQAQALSQTLSLVQRAAAASAAAQGQFGGGASSSRPATANTAATNSPNGSASDLQSVNQQSIARLRGDAGFLAGFAMNQPLAASRATPVTTAPDIAAPVVNETFSGPVSIVKGNGNVVQQQVSGSGSGATAQQQIVTTNGGAGLGSSNLAQGQSH
jgi:hypothetical protein